jgi:hypothetical protein
MRCTEIPEENSPGRRCECVSTFLQRGSGRK